MKEKKRDKKFLEIVALIIALLALLFGVFIYAKARSFNIKEKPTVNPGGTEKEPVGGKDIKILFAPTNELDKLVEDKEIKIEGVSNTGENLGEANVINTSSGTVANIKTKFTVPGQSVSYVFYSHNKGLNKVYLDSVIFGNVNGYNYFRKCTVVNPKTTNKGLVSKACESISMTVNIGNDVITNGSKIGIKNHKLDVNNVEKVVITIKYDEKGTPVDGDFIIEFGTVTLTYLSNK